MKNITLSLLFIGALCANAAELDVLKANSGADLVSLTLSAQATAKDGSILFAKQKAKNKAIDKAQSATSGLIADICSNGILDYALDEESKDCDILNPDKAEVKCEVITNVMCHSFIGIKSREGLRLKIGKLSASEACTDLLAQDYVLDDTLVNQCNMIQNEIQFECVEILSRYYTMKTYAITECSKFQNEYALNVMRYYNGEGDGAERYESPGVATVASIAKVDTQEEESCVINKLKLGTISATDINACTNQVTKKVKTFLDKLKDIFTNPNS